MKQFLYLDTDIVNSIIAQSEKGLIQEQSEENGSDKKKGTHISGSMEGSGTAGGSFLKFWQLLLYRTFYKPVMRCCLRATSASLTSLKHEMLALAAQLPEYPVVMGMFGVGPTLGPQLIAEIGDVRRFYSKKALVAYAGLTLRQTIPVM